MSGSYSGAMGDGDEPARACARARRSGRACARPGMRRWSGSTHQHELPRHGEPDGTAPRALAAGPDGDGAGEVVAVGRSHELLRSATASSELFIRIGSTVGPPAAAKRSTARRQQRRLAAAVCAFPAPH